MILNFGTNFEITYNNSHEALRYSTIYVLRNIQHLNFIYPYVSKIVLKSKLKWSERQVETTYEDEIRVVS